MFPYEVGKPFPGSKLKAPGIEAPVLILNDSFLDLIIYSKNPEADSMFFTREELFYGVFQVAHIPYLIFSFPDDFRIGIGVDFYGKNPVKRQDWLQSNENRVTLLLIDAHSNIIHQKRIIQMQPSVASHIRTLCREQLQQYGSFDEVDEKIQAFEKRFSPGMLSEMTMMFKATTLE